MAYRVPELVPYIYSMTGSSFTNDYETMEQNNLLEPRRSSRVKKPAQHLIEDSNWN